VWLFEKVNFKFEFGELCCCLRNDGMDNVVTTKESYFNNAFSQSVFINSTVGYPRVYDNEG